MLFWYSKKTFILRHRKSEIETLFMRQRKYCFVKLCNLRSKVMLIVMYYAIYQMLSYVHPAIMKATKYYLIKCPMQMSECNVCDAKV